MGTLLKWVGRIVSYMATASIGQGGLLFLKKEYQIVPAEWIARMIGYTVSSNASLYIWWIIVGLSGFIGLLGWIVYEHLRGFETKDSTKNYSNLSINGTYSPDYKFTDFPKSLMRHTCYVEIKNNSNTQAITNVDLRIIALKPEINGKFIDAGSLVLPQTFFPKQITIPAGTSKKWEVCQGEHYGTNEYSNPILKIIVNETYYKLVWKTALLKLEASGIGTNKIEEDFIFHINKWNAPCLIPAKEYEKWLAENT